MPRQNRVTPLGALIATPERGLVYGNRGCLHDGHGAIRRLYATSRWIACQLEFRGRHRAALMAPGRYTELFFLDEATALAAGHRPCAECRRADYNRLTQIWNTLHPEQAGADAIDGQLHGERLDPIRGNAAFTTPRTADCPMARSSCTRHGPGLSAARASCSGQRAATLPAGDGRHVARPS